MQKRYRASKRGFTLIELLVVIAIIGLLSSVVLASLNSARVKARDVRRVSDLRQVGIALQLYYDQYGTFCVAGAGSGGQGWLNLPYTSPVGVAQKLVDLGYLGGVPVDPTQTGTSAGYMIACTPSQFTLWATKEGESTLADCSLSSYDTGYGKNYCISQ